ncbi:MAG: PQQ-like beta-propeller repeat protein [Deltaproteobacteria bacterium]|nr:PQQ-like beta-propeller repeat protein [Deltaproteobacteria bacterium]
MRTHTVTSLAVVTLAAALAGGCHKTKSPVPELDCDGVVADWPQLALNPAHTGLSCAVGQPLKQVDSILAIDENIEEEKREMQGEVLVHYQQALISGTDIYVEHKSGSYVSCTPPGSGAEGCGPQAWGWQQWGERKLHWEGAQLVLDWEYVSDWVPPPNGPQLGGWEPVFHAAVHGDTLFVPGKNGSVHLVDRHTGTLVRKLDPYGSSAESGQDAYLTGPITIDNDGRALWSVLIANSDDPWEVSSLSAAGYLVRGSVDGNVEIRPYGNLIPQAPLPTDTCESSFPNSAVKPFPPIGTNGAFLTAPRITCGGQRAPINFSPAVALDGTIYVATRAHRSDRTGFVAALNPDLTLRWATSLRAIFRDGCGAFVPYGTDDANCREGAAAGVDPATNTPPSGRLLDDSTSTPVVLPDGSVLFGVYTQYNGFRGHLVKLSAAGKVLASYDFGWDITPSVFPHDGTYSVVLKDNHYANSAGPYAITQLSADLVPEWSYVNDNPNECTRLPDNQLQCSPTHPNGFEWCVNSVAIDRNGVVYANSEDGNLYAINPGGTLKERVFLNLSIGAAYTPLALDASGRVYTQNDGKLFVVGN